MNIENNNNTVPKVSVIMPTFNRLDLLKKSLDSILNQSYTNYELIIIDDCSSDGTKEFLEQKSKLDQRIIYIRNDKHQHYNYGLRLGCQKARGEYIARMDDDDISLPSRFEKQVSYLDKHPDIAVVGTFIEILGDNGCVKNWIDNSRPEFCAIDAFFRCPLCHPTVMIRKSFLVEKHVGYDSTALYAEDTMLWIDIILAGGKIANIPEVLLKYRVGHSRVSAESNTKKIQNKTVARARKKLWNLFFNEKQARRLALLNSYPTLIKTHTELINALVEIAEKNHKLFPREVVYDYLSHMGIKSEYMRICFAGNNNIAEQMCVAMTSIVRHNRNIDTIEFFILENDITNENKKKIMKLEQHNVAIEFINIDVDSFSNRCPKGAGCQHVPVQTYFRYIIPQLKPHYEKVLYLDCDIIVRKSLCELWSTDLGDNYAAAVQEFYFDAENQMKIKVSPVFNAGILLLNNKKLVEDFISDKLFYYTEQLKDKIVYVDQDILNYIFTKKVLWINPIYNAQSDLWRPGTCAKPIYNAEQMWWAKNDPVIIHYNGPSKPWNDKGYITLMNYHPFVNEYSKVHKISPFKITLYMHTKLEIKKIFMLVIKKIKNFLFIKNNNDLDYTKFKIIFIKLKKRKFLKPSLFLQKIDYANSHIYTTEKKLDELIKTIDNFQNQVIELNNKINELTLNKHK